MDEGLLNDIEEEEEEEAGLTASLYYKELTNEAIEYISIYVTKSNLKVPSSTFQ